MNDKTILFGSNFNALYYNTADYYNDYRFHCMLNYLISFLNLP